MPDSRFGNLRLGHPGTGCSSSSEESVKVDPSVVLVVSVESDDLSEQDRLLNLLFVLDRGFLAFALLFVFG